MDESSRLPRVVRFGTFEVDLQVGELRKDGLKVRLQEQPFRILSLLLVRPGEIVTREELRRRLWPGDVFVAFDQGLNNAIKKLRTSLGDSAENPRFVETVARHGYRFIAPVAECRRPPTAAPRPRVRARVAIGIAVSAALMILAAYLAFPRARTRSRPPPGRITLVVLPFENLSGDPGQEYFSDGLTDEMITQLGNVNRQRLAVLARTSAMRYKHANKSVDEIQRELHVDYLVEGSVRRGGQQVRITAQLIRASDQTHVWAKSYERDLRDILTLQIEVAQDIAREINVNVTPEGQSRLARSLALSTEARESYVKGRYFWNKRTEDGLRKGIEYFQHAIGAEPGYAAAHDGQADCWIALGWYGYLPPRKAFPRAEESARRALALDDSLAAAHTSLAFVRFNYAWNWSEAERGFRRAIELDSDYANAHHWYADYLSAMGRHDQAIAESERARELDPLSNIINAWLGWRHYFARRYDRAIEQYRRTLEIDPAFAPTHLVLGQAYEQKGKLPEAIAELRRAVDLAQGAPVYVAALAHAYAIAGQRAEAERELERLREVSRLRYVPAFPIAIVHAGLGRTKDALDWLDKAYDQRDPGMVWLKVDPRLDGLRSDSRFQSLVARLRFP